MADTPTKTFDAGTLACWRRWLAANHASAPEVWLVYHKKHTGKPSVTYLDALDEALCYGWIDCGVKRLDHERYAIKYRPRNAGSKWSVINRRRYAALDGAGRLAPAGKARSPRGAAVARPPKVTLPAKVPAYIARAFKAVPGVWAFFQTLSPSHQRRYFGWIHIAKQEETRQRRLREAIELLTKKQTLGLK
jgi:uncharacterized protein YdeI (YjbR/CyaY-like superfamily)